MPFNDYSGFWGFLGAAVPGVLVALLAQFLAQRHENVQRRRVSANARALVALEINANRTALADFWRAINDLDKEHANEGAEQHLAAMASEGLLGYSLPTWNVTHWSNLSPEAVGALSSTEIEKVYALYADLDTITQLYSKIATVPPEELKQYSEGGSMQRFWYNYFAGRRVTTFERLQQTVARVLTANNPLAR